MDNMKVITELQRTMLKEYNLNALVTMTPENITYVTGVQIPTQITVRSREVIHIVTMERGPEVIIVNIEEPLIKMEGWMPKESITSYNEFTQSPILLAIEKLKELGMENKRIGMELSYLPVTDMEKIKKELPHAQIVNADAVYEEMRLVKMQFEIDRITEFGADIEDVIYTAFDTVREGMTEKELYNVLVNGFNAIGGDKMSVPMVASGERSCLLNGAPTDRVMKKGDIVRVDMMGIKNNYYCDCCRTAIVGEPKEHHINIYSKVVKAHDNTIRRLRPGVSTKHVYDEFLKEFTGWGFEPIAFVGHGLGLTLHEEPYINPYKDTVLKKNMVLCVEPIHIIDGVCGYQLENEVLITEDGCRMITGTGHSYDRLPVIKVN